MSSCLGERKVTTVKPTKPFYPVSLPQLRRYNGYRDTSDDRRDGFYPDEKFLYEVRETVSDLRKDEERDGGR